MMNYKIVFFDEEMGQNVYCTCGSPAISFSIIYVGAVIKLQLRVV